MFEIYVQVFCEDCSDFVMDVMARRGLTPQTCDVHCGFDGGQGMLKLGVTITDKEELEKTGRSHYSEVVQYKLTKSSANII